MIGTLLNVAAILAGGLTGLLVRRPMTAPTQVALKGVLGVAAVYVGLRTAWLGLFGAGWLGWGPALKQVAILLLGLTFGRLAGQLLHLQPAMNRAGQWAKELLGRVSQDSPGRFADGFLVATVLFCVAPLALIGAVQDGAAGHWQPLALKAAMDGLATMAFVRSLGWGAMLAALPVLSLQGTLWLGARALAPWLEAQQLLGPLNAVAGMLVFSVALVILELKKVELGNYLPSLAVAPLLAWLWR